MAEQEQGRRYATACIGDKYNQLTVVAYAKAAPDGRRTVVVDCECGTRGKRVRVNHLVSNAVKSCGCERDRQSLKNIRNTPSHKRKAARMEAAA